MTADERLTQLEETVKVLSMDNQELRRKVYELGCRTDRVRDKLDLLLDFLKIRITKEERWRVDKDRWWRQVWP